MRLRESKDAQGHEHAADGRFGTTAGQHDRGDKKGRRSEARKQRHERRRAEAEARRDEADATREAMGDHLSDVHPDVWQGNRRKYGLALAGLQDLIDDVGPEELSDLTDAERVRAYSRVAGQAAYVSSQLATADLPEHDQEAREQIEDAAEHVRQIALLAVRAKKAAAARAGQAGVRESLAPAAGVSLAVPVVLQGTNFSCGRAALQATLNFLGVPADNLALGRALGTDPALGTRPEALVDVVRSLGLPHEVRDGASVEDLAAALSRGAPCICCVQRDGVGHWVVVSGVGAGGASVRVMDPMAGVRDVPCDEWMRGWWDEAGGVRYDRWALAVGAPVSPAAGS